MASSETLRRRSGPRRVGGPPRPGCLRRRWAVAESVQVTGSQRLPVLHGDRVLFLGGFFVLTFWANTGSAAEERLGWPSALGCEGQPRPVV